MNTEIIEFLKLKNVKIASTSKAILKCVETYKENGYNANLAFKNLKVTRNDEKQQISSLLNLIQDSKETLSKICNTSSDPEILITMLTSEAERKDDYNKEHCTKRMLDVENEAKTDYYNKLIGNEQLQLEQIQIFETITNVQPNKADFDLYECFMIADDNVVFKSDDTCKLIFQKQSGALDFNNDLSVYSSDQSKSFISKLQKEFGSKYCNYIVILKTLLAGISKDDIEEAAENKVALIENLFINGIEVNGAHYIIPCSFIHFLSFFIEWKVCKDNKGKVFKVFNGFKIKSADKKALPRLRFDEFLEYFSVNFKRLTKGCISSTNKWKSYSNKLKDCALCYKPIWEDWETAKIPTSWQKFFYDNGGKASERILNRVFCYIGMCIDANNKSQQALLIADDGGTGKGETIRLLQEILPDGMMKSFSNSAIQNPRFAVTSHKLYSAHIIYNTEYDGKCINTQIMKQIIGGDTIDCEVKGGNDITWNTSGTKFIFTSNRICYMTEHAIRRRIIPVSFKTNHDLKKGMDQQFRSQLLKDGEAFLKFCYYRYMKNPFRNSWGDYLVMNKEQEVQFLKNGTYPNNSEFPVFLMKAFSKDEELNEKFRSGDWDEEGHANDDFNDLYDLLFEYDDQTYMTVQDLKDAIETFFEQTIKPDCPKQIIRLKSCLEFNIEHGRQILTNMNSFKNKMFRAFIQKTKGHVWGKVKKIDGKPERIVTSIKLKQNEEESNVGHIEEDQLKL